MNSTFLNLNWKDFVKGLILSVLTAIFTIVLTSLEAGSLSFDYKLIGMTALSAGVAYITKNLFQNTNGSFGKEPK